MEDKNREHLKTIQLLCNLSENIRNSNGILVSCFAVENCIHVK